MVQYMAGCVLEGLTLFCNKALNELPFALSPFVFASSKCFDRVHFVMTQRPSVILEIAVCKVPFTVYSIISLFIAEVSACVQSPAAL